MQGLLDRALCKKEVEFYWNFTRVYVDANKINMLFQGILAGETLYLTSQFLFAAPQIGALSEMVEYQTEFRDGIWFDLNIQELLRNGGGNNEKIEWFQSLFIWVFRLHFISDVS